MSRYKSMISDLTIDDPGADRSNGQRIGRYHIGEKAIYVPSFPFDRYIPFEAIKRAWSQSSQLPVTGCCGKGVPVVVVCVMYDSGEAELRAERYTLDSQDEADMLLERLRQGVENLVMESPYK